MWNSKLDDLSEALAKLDEEYEQWVANQGLPHGDFDAISELDLPADQKKWLDDWGDRFNKVSNAIAQEQSAFNQADGPGGTGP